MVTVKALGHQKPDWTGLPNTNNPSAKAPFFAGDMKFLYDTLPD